MQYEKSSIDRLLDTKKRFEAYFSVMGEELDAHYGKCS